MTVKYLIAAHTEAQVYLFLRNQGVLHGEVRRVRRVEEVMGRNTDLTLLLLPAWWDSQQTEDAVRVWRGRGGKVVHVSEDVVLGRAAFKP